MKVKVYLSNIKIFIILSLLQIKMSSGSSMVATLLVTLGIYIVLQHNYVHAAPSSSDVVAAGSSNLESASQRTRTRPFLQTSPRASQYMRARLVPMESSDLLNDFVIDDDNIDFSTVNDNLTIMVT